MKPHYMRHLLAAAVIFLTGAAASSLQAQTSVTYIGGNGGTWTIGSNWTGGVAPTTTSFNATVNNGNTVNMPFVSITINDFNLSNGGISGSALTVAGQTNLGIGVVVGNNQLLANGGINFSGSATLQNVNSLNNGDGTLAATANWGSGTLSFTSSAVRNSANATWNANSGLYDSVSGGNTFRNNGIFNKETAGTLTIEPVFEQQSTGTLNVNAGELQLLGGGNHQGVTTVLNGTTLTLAGTHLFAGGGFPGSLTVGATATLNVSGGTTTIDFPYNHVGTATVASGAALNFINTGTHTHSGTFTPAAGGAVNFNAGTHTLTTAAVHNGAGSVNVNGGTVSLATGVALTGAGGFNVAGGTLSVAGVSSVSNPFGFTSGFVSGGGTFTTHGAATLSGSGSKQINGGTVFNLGDGIGAAGSTTASWTAGSIDIRTSGVLNIKSDGAFSTNFDGSLANGGGGAATFNVEAGGSFTKSGGAGTTSVGLGGNAFAFNNSGTVNVQTGTLLIGAGTFGGTHTGAFDISGGANLNLGGAHTLNAGVSFTGAGTTTFSGTVTANSTVPIASAFTLTGTLTGAGPVNVTGAATWSSGVMSGVGTTNILTSLALSTGGNKQIESSRVVNLGDGIGAAGSTTASWTAGTMDIRTGGTMNIKSDGAFSTSFDGSIGNGGGGAATINVEAGGSFTKSGGTGTTTIGSGVTFNNIGTVNANSGTLSIGATVTQHSGTTLTGGTWNVTSTTPNSSTLTFATGSNITTIGSAASVTLDGAGSTFNRLGPVTASTLTTNQGGFALKNDRDLTTAGAYANSGTTRVEDSATVMTIGAGGGSAYTQTGPSSVTILAGGAMIDSSAFNLNGGALRGTGTIDGPLSATTANATTIAPGASPGTLTINGSTILGANNTLAMEVGGMIQGIDYDFLNVIGVLTLGGFLDIDLINGFENSVLSSDVFTLATATSPILGGFSNVASGSYLVTNFPTQFQVWYGAGSPFGDNNLVITGAPEPSRALLVVLGLAGMVMRRRRE